MYVSIQEMVMGLGIRAEEGKLQAGHPSSC